MKDFTKIKLINSLIDVVDRFYELKNEADDEASSHLKGFCEGMAYSMMELGFLDKDETKKIMSGLGKKISEDELVQEDKEEIVDIPKPKLQESTSDIQLEIEDLKLNEHIHNTPIFTPQRELDDLDLPTYLRKKREL
jgi:hypothetical protein